MAKKIEPSAPPAVNRTERVLLFMILAIVVVSVLAFFTRLVGTAAGVTDFTAGVWPALTILPLIGLPIAFAMLLAFVVASAVRRSRDSRGTRR
ncbi:hypothetical protein [Frigoribacterium sp. VKM Ac-2836]|uniref:hypothetical protein n=1 Tax=Frigoribacterium sp. VKM Ac-2836 TaxID=2739014 RepID=UPI0015673367|nr:hypothetical protein [Frigoribacterium sp. VKM Ac-2836]NRD26904.1 hypothetical protein [Frigoribacterium sp. VKM Ac-2836]